MDTRTPRYLQHAVKYANRMMVKNNLDDNWSALCYAREFLRRVKFADWICGIITIDLSLDNANSDRCCEYWNAGDTYTETIIAENGKAFVGSWGDWYESAESEYCKENNVVRCSYCSEFVPMAEGTDWSKLECECRHYANGSDIPDEGSQLENCDIVEDIDSHKMWLCKERLPTHETKSRHTLLFVKLEYLDYHGKEIVKELGKYCVSIVAVNPSMAGKQKAMQACESIGMDYDDEYRKLPIDVRAMTLADYGIKATLWEQCGNSSDELLTKANTELSLVHMLGGFYLDKPQNALGSTGWDFMRGDILAGLKTCKTPESDIVRKMMGKQQ